MIDCAHFKGILEVSLSRRSTQDRFLLWLTYILLIGLGITTSSRAETTLPIDPNAASNPIQASIYSHFLEHIYHSVHGGLWGEILWNRSFEEPDKTGFNIDENRVRLLPQHPYHHLLLGQWQWRNYQYNVEVKKMAGSGGILLLFRSRNPSQTYRLRLNGLINGQHVLEKQRAHGQVQSLATFDGRLIPGQWYHIQIDCQGSRIQCHINQESIIDYTDQNQPYLSGKIGMAVTDNLAEFSAPKVIDPNGTVLLDSLEPCQARYWHPLNPGHACLDFQQRYNSNSSLLITGPDARIQQTPIIIVAHETYKGSLWAKGITRTGLTLRLLDGDRLLAEQKIRPSSTNWTKIPFTLSPNDSSTSATFEMYKSDPGSLWIDQVSLMANSSQQTGGFKPNFVRILAELRPKMLRWPGGYFVSHYHWKDGIGPQDQRRVSSVDVWDDRDTNAFGIDEFLRLCQTIGAEPIIVVNSHPAKNASEKDIAALLQDTLDLMQYCNGSTQSTWGKIRSRNGHPEPYRVKYWELDDMVTDQKMNLALRWAQAMKEGWPKIELMIDAPFGNSPEDLALIQETLSRFSPWIDYISIEHYAEASEFQSALTDWERYLNNLRTQISQCPNPKIRVTISEWNLFSGNWRNGLYVGCLLNLFERNSDLVEITSPAILMRHISGWGDHALIQFDQSRWFPSPGHQVWKLWHDFYAPNRLDLPYNPSSPLNIITTRDENHRWIYLKIVNPTFTPEPLSLQLPRNADFHHIQQWMIKARLGQKNSLMQPDNIAPTYLELDLSGDISSIDIPGYSVNVIAVRLLPEDTQSRVERIQKDH